MEIMNMSYVKMAMATLIILLYPSIACSQDFLANNGTFQKVPLSTSVSGVLSNSQLAQMPAMTVKCNASSITANASDCSTIFLSIGAADPTSPRYQIPTFVEQFGIAGAYADSAAGNIFNLSSWASNSGSAPVVGVFGEGIGDGATSHSWGGNFVAYANANGAVAIGEEIDFGTLIAGGVSYGIVDVYTGTQNSSGNYLQFQANNAFAPANGIIFNGSVHPVIQNTGSLITTSGAQTVTNGVDLSAATISGSSFKSTGFSVDGSGNVTAASVILPAWTAYNPTIGCGSGTITTLGAVSGRYKTIGKTVLIKVDISITTNGTCATSITSSLPVAGNDTYILGGQENTVGTANMGLVSSASSTMTITTYANAYPGATGAHIIISGVYESQ